MSAPSWPDAGSQDVCDLQREAAERLRAADHALAMAIVAMIRLRDAVEPLRSMTYDEVVVQLQDAEGFTLRARRRLGCL